MKTYQGSCHCGKVRYEVDLDLAKPVIACNCSMCGRKGSLLTFTDENHFRLKQGEENLTDYVFNKKVIHHLFCKFCGVTSFARGSKDGQTYFAINARCLEDLNLDSLAVQKFDGKNI